MSFCSIHFAIVRISGKHHWCITYVDLLSRLNGRVFSSVQWHIALRRVRSSQRSVAYCAGRGCVLHGVAGAFLTDCSEITLAGTQPSARSLTLFMSSIEVQPAGWSHASQPSAPPPCKPEKQPVLNCGVGHVLPTVGWDSKPHIRMCFASFRLQSNFSSWKEDIIEDQGDTSFYVFQAVSQCVGFLAEGLVPVAVLVLIEL